MERTSIKNRYFKKKRYLGHKYIWTTKKLNSAMTNICPVTMDNGLETYGDKIMIIAKNDIIVLRQTFEFDSKERFI